MSYGLHFFIYRYYTGVNKEGCGCKLSLHGSAQNVFFFRFNETFDINLTDWLKLCQKTINYFSSDLFMISRLIEKKSETRRHISASIEV